MPTAAPVESYTYINWSQNGHLLFHRTGTENPTHHKSIVLLCRCTFPSVITLIDDLLRLLISRLAGSLYSSTAPTGTAWLTYNVAKYVQTADFYCFARFTLNFSSIKCTRIFFYDIFHLNVFSSIRFYVQKCKCQRQRCPLKRFAWDGKGFHSPSGCQMRKES